MKPLFPIIKQFSTHWFFSWLERWTLGFPLITLIARTFLPPVSHLWCTVLAIYCAKRYVAILLLCTIIIRRELHSLMFHLVSIIHLNLPFCFVQYIVECAQFKIFSLFRFNNILTKMFNFFHTPIKLILRQVHNPGLSFLSLIFQSTNDNH